MLSKQRMEATVLLEVERARKDRKGYEGTFVELKRSLPEDRRRAARQLAAICNAARGEQVLWIVGIDDKTGDVHHPSTVDIQDWWPGVVRYFDEVPPDMSSIAVPVGDGETVLALFFETDRAPYVVTTDGHGQAQLEVPWRDGTTTRSAKRRELLRMVTPAVPMPMMDPIEATIRNRSDDLLLFYKIFIDVVQPITLPRYRQQAAITISARTFDLEVWFEDPESSLVRPTREALRIDSPNLVALYANGVGIPSAVLQDARTVAFSVTISISGSDSRATFKNIARRKPHSEEQVWRWTHR